MHRDRLQVMNANVSNKLMILQHVRICILIEYTLNLKVSIEFN